MHAVALAGLALILGLAGCAKFTMNTVSATRLAKGATVGVVLMTPDKEPGSMTAMEGYLTVSLMARGLQVTSIRLEQLVGDAMLKRALPGGTFSASENFARGLSKGGELEADEEFVGQMLTANEMSEASQRLTALVGLTKDFRESLGLQYLLVVHQFDAYGYAVYAVRLEDRAVVSAMVVSGNRDGYIEALGEPVAGIRSRAKDGDVTRLDYLRLSEFIASHL